MYEVDFLRGVHNAENALASLLAAHAAGASFGLQIGAQIKSEVILFMTKESLSKFQNSRGWKVGVDGSVALIKLGGGGSIDTTTIASPVIGFIFSNEGLMYNLTLEGAKFTKLVK